MVRIEYFGAWEDENAQTVREIVAAKIKENKNFSTRMGLKKFFLKIVH